MVNFYRLVNFLAQRTYYWYEMQIQQLQHQGHDAREQAETLAAKLDKVLSSREQALLDAKEGRRTAEHGLAMKTEECKRMQDQQAAFLALVSTLEADLSAANASMSEARAMVTENRQAMQKQRAWIQTAMVREEQLVEKCDEHASALAVERQQHSKTKQALCDEIATAAALLGEKNERDSKAKELLAERAALQDEIAQHKEDRTKSQQHLKKTNELLQSARDALQGHEEALNIMESKLAAIGRSKAQTVAAHAALLAKQEQELASLRTELAALKHSQRQSSKARLSDSLIAQATPASWQPAEGAQQGRIVKEGSAGQRQSKGEVESSDAKQEMGTTGSAMSKGEALPDSQSPVDAGKYQKPADGTSKDIDSRPCGPLAQLVSLDSAPASGKRQRSLPHPLITPGSALQPVADTPDELEVLSDNHSGTHQLGSPAKKPCLQSVAGNSQNSHHNQPVLNEEQPAMDRRDAENDVAQKVTASSRSQGAPLPPATVLATNGAQDYTEGGQLKAAAIGNHSAREEGGQVEQAAKHGQADVFDAFAAFEGMEEGE